MAPPRGSNARFGLPTSPSPRMRTLSDAGAQAAMPLQASSAAADRAAVRSGTPSMTPPQSNRTRPPRMHPRNDPGTGSAAERARADALRVVPPLPALPPPPTTHTMELYEGRNGSAASIASASSTGTHSSTSADLWPRSAASDASITSIEDVADDDTHKDSVAAAPAPGFGSSLWGRVAAAAGSLSVSVSRAWEANIGVSPGEVTPPGEDSRLARAIKAYHIEKARQPSDLPDWLFSEKERGVRTVARAAEPAGLRGQPTDAPQRAVSPSRGDPRARAKAQADGEADVTVSRAAQRLRELRGEKAAKRTPTIRFVDTPHPRHAAKQRVQEDAPSPPPADPLPLPELPEPRLVTNVRPVASLKSIGKRPNAVGLPTSVRPRKP